MKMPEAKAAPTQALLGGVYDDLDSAIDIIECVYQATHGPDPDGDALRAVIQIAKDRVAEAKAKLHPTIAWA